MEEGKKAKDGLSKMTSWSTAEAPKTRWNQFEVNEVSMKASENKKPSLLLKLSSDDLGGMDLEFSNDDIARLSKMIEMIKSLQN